MKERPVIFSAEMVRAILEGRKTQTRRVLKPQPDSMKPLGEHGSLIPYRMGKEIRDMPGVRLQEIIRCPYGVAGDRLWVRERLTEVIGGWIYVADCAPVAPTGNRPPISKSGRDYCPSIHMPRWASRITIEITGVRVERLQDISEEDAMAEGIETTAAVEAYRHGHAGFGAVTGMNAHKMAFARLDSINGVGAWDKNSWCWVLEFKKL